MHKMKILEQVYKFIEQGVIFNLADGNVKVMLKKSTSEETRNDVRRFLASHKDKLKTLLAINNNTLSSSPLILKSNDNASMLSFGQERLWFIDKYEQGTAAYNVFYKFKLPDFVDIAFLTASFLKVIERHAILRTLIREDEEGIGYQEIIDLATMPFLIEHRLQKSISCLKSELAKEAKYIFKLDTEYPVRVAIYFVEETREYFLSLVIHHIACDGWSVDIILRDLHWYYYQRTDLPNLAIEYKDFAIWQRSYLQGKRESEQLSYWKSQLANYSPLNLQTDKIRPSHFDYQGDNIYFEIDSLVSHTLRELAKQCKTSLYTVLLTGFYLLLRAYSGQDDIIIGTPLANRHYQQIENLVGLFINSLVLRINTNSQVKVNELIQHISNKVMEAQFYQDLPFEKLIEELELPRDTTRHPLFQVMFTVQGFGSNHQYDETKQSILQNCEHSIDYSEAKYDLSLYIDDSKENLTAHFNYATSLFEAKTIQRWIKTYQYILNQIAEFKQNEERSIANLHYVDKDKYQIITQHWNNTDTTALLKTSVSQLFEDQVSRSSNSVAVVYNNNQLTYHELNAKANLLAHCLKSKYYLQHQDLIILCLERTEDLIIAILAVAKLGCIYVPVDPTYPNNRINYILQDTRAKLVITHKSQESKLNAIINSSDNSVYPALSIIDCDLFKKSLVEYPASNLKVESKLTDLAYIIYTSGTTGNPKGVMIKQSSVVNFLVHMDIGETAGTWLAVTKITFDISVLELLGTLIKGFKVIIHPDILTSKSKAELSHTDKPMNFSLFYFGNYESAIETAAKRYDILMQGAKYADENGFSAVWTPERHFASFGGLYPNPAVTSAAIAAITSKIKIRSGSCVLPLHNPIRVAEDWALIDNLSHGRVGMSLASGWHDNDFILAPDNFYKRKDLLFDGMSLLQKLWRGENVEVTNIKGEPTSIKIFPRPIQAEIPIWITAAGNPETFRQAGKVGANLLTHLLGQSIEELQEKIKIYRQALVDAGHDSKNFTVSLMIHTFVSHKEDYVLDQVKAPFKNYLKDAVGLLKKQTGEDDLSGLSESETDAILEQAFLRYYKSSGLFGTPDSCLSMVNKLKGIGIDELACLIDFGIANEIVLDNLKYLNTLREKTQVVNSKEDSFADLIFKHKVSHIQCTPSLAQLIFDDEDKTKFHSLQSIFVGGEEMSSDIAKKITHCSSVNLYNMYGPTEATIWASRAHIHHPEHISLGKPLANTKLYILTKDHQLCDEGMIGELHISGVGLAQGYLNNERLTAERFIENPFASQADKEKGYGRLYKTGDLCRYLEGGQIHYLSRTDNQIKLRGYRIELSEIEHYLNSYPDVKKAIVLAKNDRTDKNANGYSYLVAYYIADSEIGDKVLARHLAENLPEHMIPRVFICIEKIPLTFNGKLDIKALPDVKNGNTPPYVAPTNDIDTKIVNVYAEVLGLSSANISMLDNFFQLGGNSIAVIRLVRKLTDLFNIDIPITLIFENTTIESLCEKLHEEYQLELKGEELEF
jgi:natural product biosynthesis luciferase-like monooxygenase protein